MAGTTQNETDAVNDFFDYLDTYLATDGSKSIKQLAEDAGISRAYLYKLANRDREPTYSVAARMIKAMGGSLEILNSELSHS